MASSELCEKITSALHHAAREIKCRIVVHQCEFIAEVLRLKPELGVDFIIFAIDGRVNQSVAEVLLLYFIFFFFSILKFIEKYKCLT